MSASLFKQYMKVREADDNAHAVRSASGSKRWLGCPASIRLSKGIPSKDTEASIDGTNAHTLLQFILENYSSYERLLASPAAKEFKKFIGFNEAQLAAVMVAARYVWAEMKRMKARYGVMPQLFTEEKLHLEGVGFGTSDIILYHPFGLLHVIDYKNGKYKVDPVENTQGLYYGCAAADRFGWDFSEMWITIIQPNLKSGNPVATWKVPSHEHLERAQRIFLKGAALTKKKNAPVVPHHDYCWFCPARPKCPAQLDVKREKIMGRFTRE